MFAKLTNILAVAGPRGPWGYLIPEDLYLQVGAG